MDPWYCSHEGLTYGCLGRQCHGSSWVHALRGSVVRPDQGKSGVLGEARGRGDMPRVGPDTIWERLLRWQRGREGSAQRGAKDARGQEKGFSCSRSGQILRAARRSDDDNDDVCSNWTTGSG